MRRKKDVAKTIKFKLIDLDMTQNEFASKCGIVYSYFSKLLNGKANWTVKTAEKVIALCPELRLEDFGFKAKK